MNLPFSNNADQIIPNLWLRNLKAAQDEVFLKNAKIQVVVNCTKDAPFHPSIRRRYRVPVDDNLQEQEIRNLELWSFEIVYKMIQEYKEGRPIFVHCHAGMSRSTSIAWGISIMRGADPLSAFLSLKDAQPKERYGYRDFIPNKLIVKYLETILSIKTLSDIRRDHATKGWN